VAAGAPVGFERVEAVGKPVWLARTLQSCRLITGSSIRRVQQRLQDLLGRGKFRQSPVPSNYFRAGPIWFFPWPSGSSAPNFSRLLACQPAGRRRASPSLKGICGCVCWGRPYRSPSRPCPLIHDQETRSMWRWHRILPHQRGLAPRRGVFKKYREVHFAPLLSLFYHQASNDLISS
jgi:hypothetical protein